MTISRETVVGAYRLILGREPESEDVILQYMKLGSVEQLREEFLQSEEFLAKAAGRLFDAPQFKSRYKQALTGTLQGSALNDPDYPYVGIEEVPGTDDFFELFNTVFAPRLMGTKNREPGFRRMFEALRDLGLQRPLILESGCLRVPGNWAGDGQSTFLLDAYARLEGADFFSVDNNPESVDSARRACSDRTQLILNDSVAAFITIASICQGRRVDLLYLDSFDLDPDDPAPSAAHHAREFEAIRSLVKSGTIICVDDFRVGDMVGGKGALIEARMREMNARVLHDGYQKVWQVR
ncbi:MAG: hypothetical protein CL535_18460 [Ahrensia sp.]|nr:hypothetical protein [Ahrensia sp.]|tara:strand:- start:35953 stop:36837 length:885 start_codon:yes stop_codon:yes gene_type:complete